jgi:hypothetical protein
MGHAWVNVTYLSEEDYNAWAAAHKPKRAPKSPVSSAAAAGTAN